MLALTLVVLTAASSAFAAACPARFRLHPQLEPGQCVQVEPPWEYPSDPLRSIRPGPCFSPANASEIFSWTSDGELRINGKCVWGGDNGSRGTYVSIPAYLKDCPSPPSDDLFRWTQQQGGHIRLTGANRRCSSGSPDGCCLQSMGGGNYVYLQVCETRPDGFDYPRQQFILEPV